jgi:hypothetical protein
MTAKNGWREGERAAAEPDGENQYGGYKNEPEGNSPA